VPRNVEVKAAVADLAAVEARARAIATEGPIEIAQDDTFFACASGRLKLREFGDGRGELIHYSRGDDTGPKPSDYIISATPDPEVLRETLGRALGTIGRVRKRRRLYLCDRTRIHLDQVDGLGDFVELEVVLGEGESVEAGESEARRILAALGIDASRLVAGAYLDLLRATSAPPSSR
jgi:adenylate cyclase class IV